jgi:hypothetical protein
VVSIFVSHRISIHSDCRAARGAMLIAVEVCDGRTHLVGRSSTTHRHQDADAREVAVAGARTARVGTNLGDARDVLVTRRRGVPRAMCVREESAGLNGVRQ